MKNNNFLIYLALGVMILASTIIFGVKKPNNTTAIQKNKSPESVFEGRWTARRETKDEKGDVIKEDSYEIVLKEDLENELFGSHCFVIDNAAKSDCEPVDTISGEIVGNTAKVLMQSSFSESRIEAEITVNGNILIFKTSQPNDTVPKELYLQRDKELTKDYLMGIWQDSPTMASGWGDHYNFYKSGKFKFFVNSMLCDARVREVEGGWVWDEGKLVLTSTKQFVVSGGVMIKALGSCASEYEIDAGELHYVDFPTPKVEVFTVKQNIMKEDDFHESITLTNAKGEQFQYWKFEEDPTSSGEFPE